MNQVFGTLPKTHPAALPFQAVPSPRASEWYAAIPFGLVAILTIAVLAWINRHEGAMAQWGFLGFLFGFGSWAAVTAGSLVGGAMLVRRRPREFDRRRLGPSEKASVYVGIAYAEGFWTLRGDPAWDRGFLTISSDGLQFRGHASEIALPAHAIRGVRVEFSRNPPHDRVPRLFVDWISPDGEENAFSLDCRPLHFGAGAVSQVVALRDEIQNALQAPSERPLSPLWPPAVRLERLDLRASQMTVTLRDLVVFAIGVVPGAVLSMAIITAIAAFPMREELRQTLKSIYGGISPIIPGFTGVAAFVWHITRKYKALPEPDTAVIDPLPLVTPKLEEAAETYPIKP